jgi:hypothetical protein
MLIFFYVDVSGYEETVGYPMLRNPNEGLCGQIPNIALRAIASLYIEHVPLIWNREEKETRGPTLHHVSRVLSVVLMGRDTGHPHLLAPNLLTGGKGADLVIRGNVVLNTLSARSTSMLLRRDQICINSSSSRQVPGLAELSYATDFDSLYAVKREVCIYSRSNVLLIEERKLCHPNRPAGGLQCSARQSSSPSMAAPPHGTVGCDAPCPNAAAWPT